MLFDYVRDVSCINAHFNGRLLIEVNHENHLIIVCSSRNTLALVPSSIGLIHRVFETMNFVLFA